MPTTATLEPPTLVIGLGNPILGDDGVGWRVADEVERRLAAGPSDPAAVVEHLAVGGLTLMERLVGTDRAILVDSLVAATPRPGTVRVDSLGALGGRPAGHLDSGHDASLVAALDAAAALGARLPGEVLVVTVEVERCDTFADALSPAVAAAVPEAADAVMELLADTLALAETWR
jgi:hydrogenase maturation protease